MTITHLVLRYAHISMGMVSLMSGAGAMTLRKGSTLHRQSGNVFFVAMLLMSTTGIALSIFIVPNAGNVMGGLMAFYFTATAWLTVWRKPGENGRLEIGGMLLGLTIASTGLAFGLKALDSPNGTFDGYPPPLYFIFGGVALLGAVLDVRMLARGGFTGAARLTRHLWRMCVAMFLATSSFFLGQAKLFPIAVRKSGVLTIPVLLVVGAFLYWLIRVRIWPAIKRARAPRVAQSLRST
jgi:uncharacterized membrane protein